MNSKTESQSQMFANRLRKRFRHLKKWAQRTGVDVFRLYDRDIPEVPLVLDYYGGAQPQDSAQAAALSGALYKRPYEKDEADEELWLCAMKESAAAALGIDSGRIFLKQRLRQRGASQYEKAGSARYEKIVSEGGLSFKVNLSDYLDTGLFPDRRLLRAIVRSAAAGKRVLNLFSYTGSFSVYAAAGGAVSTDSVDLSNTYQSRARENFSLNGFSAQLIPRQEDFFRSHSVNKNRLIRADALKFIEKAAAVQKRWDIIVLDPPSFSNSKKMTGNFDLQRDMAGLISQCLKLLASAGKLFISINMRHSAATAQDLRTSPELISAQHLLHVTDLTDRITDEDFKGRKIPAGFLLEINAESY